MTNGPDAPPFPGGGVGLGGVFYQMDLVVGSQCIEGIEVTRTSADMHTNNGQSFFSYGVSDGLWGNIVGVGIDIGEDWDAAGGDDCAGGGYKSISWDNYFVAGADADGAEGDLQRGSTVAGRDAELGLLEGCEVQLKTLSVFGEEPAV